MANEFRQTVADNFLEFARKAFKDMADETLEERFVAVFRRKLEELPRKDKMMLAADTSEASACITTSAEMSAGVQDALKKAVSDTLELENPQVTFAVNPHLLCGIEFSVNGNVVSWNLDDYLNAFTTKMNEAFENISLRLGREEG